MQIRHLKTTTLLITALSLGPVTTHADVGGLDGRTLAEAAQPPADTTITAKVKAGLLKSSLLTGLQVKVTTEDGVVRLTGYVDLAEQVTQAENIASKVDGVRRVQNDLRIK